MTTNRLEAFSDGVLAIIITIMVLDLKIPESEDIGVLRVLAPSFLAYLLSFVILAIYWNNHHHLLRVTERISGGILWANMHLLFWLSLVPSTTAWVGKFSSAPWPAAIYGVVLLGAATAWTILQKTIINVHGPNSTLARAVGKDIKGKLSPPLYLAGVILAFVHTYISFAFYVVVSLMWLVPDKRIESELEEA